MIFWKKTGSAPTFRWILSCFSFKKDGVPSLRIETQIRDQSPDPRIHPRTGTVVRCGTTQQWTRHLHPGPRSLPYGTHLHLNLALAHQNKAVRRPDPSPVLGSGPSQTGPNHPGITFKWRAMPTMEGTVQEDNYRTEVQFKDKNLLKNKSFASSGSQRVRIRGPVTRIWT
jgi:hypothetical protein